MRKQYSTADSFWQYYTDHSWRIVIDGKLQLRSIPGTPAEIYLSRRHLRPARGLFYAEFGITNGGQVLPGRGLVASLIGDHNEVAGRHFLLLSPSGFAEQHPDGQKIRLTTQSSHGAVRLAPHEGTLGIAEGIEDALAVMQLTGVPCWAACGAGVYHGRLGWKLSSVGLGLAGFVPPPTVKRLLIFSDNDDPGFAAASILANRIFGAEIRPPHRSKKDWAEMVPC